MTYNEFLNSKIITAPVSGMRVSDEEIHPVLKPHQRDSVKWAIYGGRRGLFQSFGLGKTIQELEYCRLVIKHKGGKALIVMPLGVRQEFIHDAVELLDMPVAPAYVRNMEEVQNAASDIVITNYERVRDGDIDPKFFMACCLDEASVLRSFGSKTYQTFLNKFNGVPYKLVATATPDPNKHKELIHYAAFLEVMDSGQALTRFFQRDSTKANNLTLYPHKEEEFWLWVSTWAIFLSSPADLGYDDTGYDLPELEVRYHKLPSVNHNVVDKHGQVQMFRNVSTGLTAAAREKRESLDLRISKMVEIVEQSPTEHFILWHDLEDERRAIKKALPESVEVYGTLDLDIREQRIIDFSTGKTRLLATKKEISGQGCNFQKHCHRAIFVGIDYKFNDFIQAIHRIYRFLQTKQVIIDIIYTENEENILKELLAKWKRHDEQAVKMREIIQKNGLSGKIAIEKMKRSIGVERVEVKGKYYKAVLNDCTDEVKRMADNSIDLIHTSIPFSNHYEYTPLYNDYGHNEDNNKFFEQMDYLTPELLRILAPGRVAAVHVKDRILFGNATGDGMPTVDPFSDMTVFHYLKHGFKYMGRIIVLTDVVRENNQTYRLGWSEQCKDGTKMGIGCPEYVLLFRKLPTDTSTAYADNPVSKSKDEYTRAQWQIDAHAFHRSSGDRLLNKDELKLMPVDKLQKVYNQYSKTNIYDYDTHVEMAKTLDECGKLPASFMVVGANSWHDSIWDDVLRMKTLNLSQSQNKKQLHVCPLQLDIVERIINRYSNVGDTVLDPFGGIMTVPYMAVKMKRKGIGIELNADYFRDGVAYLQAVENERESPTLFDFIDVGG